jgi:hypothetical protein
MNLIIDAMKTQLQITYTRQDETRGELSGPVSKIRNQIFGILIGGGKIVTNKKFNCGG